MKSYVRNPFALAAALALSLPAAAEVMDLGGETRAISGNNVINSYNGKEIRNGTLNVSGTVNASLDSAFTSFTVGAGATANVSAAWQFSTPGPMTLRVQEGGALNFTGANVLNLSYRIGENHLAVDHASFASDNHLGIGNCNLNANVDKVAASAVFNDANVSLAGRIYVGPSQDQSYTATDFSASLAVTNSTVSAERLYFGRSKLFYENGALTATFKDSDITTKQFYAYLYPQCDISFDGATLHAMNGSDAHFIGQNTSVTYVPYTIRAGGLTLDFASDFTFGSASSSLQGEGGLTKIGAGNVTYTLPSGRSMLFTGPLKVKAGALTSATDWAASAIVADGGDVTITGKLTGDTLVIAATNGTVKLTKAGLANVSSISYQLGEGGYLVLDVGAAITGLGTLPKAGDKIFLAPGSGTIDASHVSVLGVEGGTVEIDKNGLELVVGDPLILDLQGKRVEQDALGTFIAGGANLVLTNGTLFGKGSAGFNKDNFATWTIETNTLVEVKDRIVINTAGEEELLVRGGEMRMNGASSDNNYLMQTSDGKLSLKVTDGGAFTVATGSVYIATSNDAANDTPRCDILVDHATFDVKGAINIGNHGNNKGATRPEVHFNATNAIIRATDTGLYIGQNTNFTDKAEGGYYAEFDHTTLYAKTIKLFHDRPASRLFFNGAKLVQTASYDQFLYSITNFETDYGVKPVSVGPDGLELSSAYAASLHADVQGAGALVKSGTGSLTVKRAQTGTGPLEVREGTLALQSAYAITRPVTVKSGATISIPSGTLEALTLEAGATLELTLDKTGSLGTIHVTTLALPTNENARINLAVDTTALEPVSGTQYRLSGLVFTEEELGHILMPSGLELKLDTDGVYMVSGSKVTTWTGAADDGLWSSAANWDNGAPSAYDTVVFDVAEGSAVVCSNDLGALAFTLIDKKGAGVVTLGGFAGATGKPALKLEAGGLVLLKGEEEAVANPFAGSESHEVDKLSVGGLVDLAGGVQTNRVSQNGFKTALSDGFVLTNGTLSVLGQSANQWMFLSPGTYTIAAGGLLDWSGAMTRLNCCQTGTMRFVVAGGTFLSASSVQSSGSYFGNADNADVHAVMEVKDNGLFRYKATYSNYATNDMFVVGRSTDVNKPAYGALLGLDAPEGGYDFTGNLIVGYGAGGKGTVALTNCALNARTILLGSPYAGSGYDGEAKLTFAGGSVVTTAGFAQRNRMYAAAVTFDDATLRIVPTDEGSEFPTSANIFPEVGATGEYTIAAGGLKLGSTVERARVWVRTPLVGEGGLTAIDKVVLVVETNQLYTGTTEISNNSWLNTPDITFAGPVKINNIDSLKKNTNDENRQPREGETYRRLFTAPAIELPEGWNAKDVKGMRFFTKTTSGGVALCYGKITGLAITLR